MEMDLEMVETQGQLSLVKRKMAVGPSVSRQVLFAEKIKVKLKIKGKSPQLSQNHVRKDWNGATTAFPLLRASPGPHSTPPQHLLISSALTVLLYWPAGRPTSGP